LTEDYGVVLFYSTSLAIRAEKLAKEAGLNVKLIPTPRHLSSDCGLAMRFSNGDEQALVRALTKGKLEYDRVAALK